MSRSRARARAWARRACSPSRTWATPRCLWAPTRSSRGCPPRASWTAPSLRRAAAAPRGRGLAVQEPAKFIREWCRAGAVGHRGHAAGREAGGQARRCHTAVSRCALLARVVRDAHVWWSWSCVCDGGGGRLTPRAGVASSSSTADGRPMTPHNIATLRVRAGTRAVDVMLRCSKQMPFDLIGCDDG